MILFETLTQHERDAYADGIEREWYVHLMPGAIDTRRERTLIVSTTYNPEPYPTFY